MVCIHIRMVITVGHRRLRSRLWRFLRSTASSKNHSDWWILHQSAISEFLTYAQVCCGLAFLFGVKFPQSSLIFGWVIATIYLKSYFERKLCCGAGSLCYCCICLLIFPAWYCHVASSVSHHLFKILFWAQAMLRCRGAFLLLGILSFVPLIVIPCHFCHFVTLWLVRNGNFGRKKTKNGFGKAFALTKSKTKIDKI